MQYIDLDPYSIYTIAYDVHRFHGRPDLEVPLEDMRLDDELFEISYFFASFAQALAFQWDLDPRHTSEIVECSEHPRCHDINGSSDLSGLPYIVKVRYNPYIVEGGFPEIRAAAPAPSRMWTEVEFASPEIFDRFEQARAVHVAASP
ncbi:hypothetical protein [Methylobacterium nodulans]|nr:hypothetical protein [Methylobacterium nodulans]